MKTRNHTGTACGDCKRELFWDVSWRCAATKVHVERWEWSADKGCEVDNGADRYGSCEEVAPRDKPCPNFEERYPKETVDPPPPTRWKRFKDWLKARWGR